MRYEMTISNNDFQLDQLFEIWIDNQNAETPLPLKNWLDRYPQLTDEFLSWHASAPLLAHMDKLPADSALEEAVLNTGMESFERHINRAESTITTIKSLLDSGIKLGFKPAELAMQIGIGKIILARLNQRLIEIETVPIQIIERLAVTLQVQIDQIKAYLSQPVQLKSGISYKADQAPRAGEKQTFQYAVESDPELSSEQKSKLLAL